MRPLPAKRIIKILEQNGYVLSRQRGSHMIFRHTTSKRIVPVPLHGGNKALPIGTFLAIIKQSQIDRDKFEK